MTRASSRRIGSVAVLALAGCAATPPAPLPLPPTGPPDVPVVAGVLGQPLRAVDVGVDEMSHWWLRALSQHYAADRGLGVRAAELLA